MLKGASPGYYSQVCLFSVLCPSFEVAGQIIDIQGVRHNLDRLKELTRHLANHCKGRQAALSRAPGESLGGTYVKLLNQIEKVPLLILDDFGLQPLDQTLRLALLQILEDRYNIKPVIVASQLPVQNWHEYLGEPTIADAIMDRLTASAHVVDPPVGGQPS